MIPLDLNHFYGQLRLCLGDDPSMPTGWKRGQALPQLLDWFPDNRDRVYAWVEKQHLREARRALRRLHKVTTR